MWHNYDVQRTKLEFAQSQAFQDESRRWYRQQRERDEKWRREDVEFREREIGVDIVHRNAEFLRRRVDEKSDQLRDLGSMAAMIAGFAMVVLVEAPLPDHMEDSGIPEPLLFFFALCTSCVVGLMLFTLLSSTQINLGLLNRYDRDNFVKNLNFDTFWKDNFYDFEKRTFRIFSFGIPLFLVSLGLLAWVKFHESLSTCIGITIVVSVAIFAVIRDQVVMDKHLRPKDDDADGNSLSIWSFRFRRKREKSDTSNPPPMTANQRSFLRRTREVFLSRLRLNRPQRSATSPTTARAPAPSLARRRSRSVDDTPVNRRRSPSPGVSFNLSDPRSPSPDRIAPPRTPHYPGLSSPVVVDQALSPISLDFDCGRVSLDDDSDDFQTPIPSDGSTSPSI